jgi:hypothetical protein
MFGLFEYSSKPFDKSKFETERLILLTLKTIFWRKNERISNKKE